MTELTNKNKAGFARDALDRYEGVTGSDEDSRIMDLLCDLMHYCDARMEKDEDARSFGGELESAEVYYLEEIKETTNET
jgi:hypothetical protein